MALKFQIISLIYSFVFGLVFSLLVNLHYEILFSKKKWFRIFMNFLFVVDMALLYFLILKKINGGMIHLYFYLLILMGFFLGYTKTIKVRSLFRRLTRSKKVL